jgi:multiple sugar transport system substrate-binding protein
MDIRKIDRYLFAAAIIILGVFTVYAFVVNGAVAGRKTTLVFTHYLGDRLDRTVLASLIREFEDQNPGIRIRLDRGRVDDPERASRANFSADLVVFDERRIGAFMEADRLASLGPYLGPAAEPDQRTLPLVSFMDLLFYNIDLLKAAGFNRPPGTRAELLACARAAAGREQGGVYGAALALSPGESQSVRRDVFSWIWAAGVPLIRDGAVEFSSPQAVEALDFLGQLHSGGLLSPGTFNKTGAEKTAEFAAGKIALMIGPAEDIPVLRKGMGDSAFGVTLIPGSGDQDGRPGISPSRWYAGISGSCKKPDKAWTFLAFLLEKSPLLAAQVKAVPGSGSSPGAYILADPLYSKAWDIYEAAELFQDFSTLPGAADLEAIVREELALLFEGKQKAAETSTAIQKRWESGSSGIPAEGTPLN